MLKAFKEISLHIALLSVEGKTVLIGKDTSVALGKAQGHRMCRFYEEAISNENGCPYEDAFSHHCVP